jgi:hypothetical protein
MRFKGSLDFVLSNGETPVGVIADRFGGSLDPVP